MLTAAVTLSGQTFASISSNGAMENIELLWKQFCQQHGAVDFSGKLSQEKSIEPCKSHEHRKGQQVWFPDQQIVAAPVWIYWPSQRNRPSDLIVNFHSGQDEVISINRFELARFTRQKDKGQSLTLLQLIEPRRTGRDFWMASISKTASGRQIIA
ncbi:hypothetical protein GCM10027051_04010 [Niabella terrae]